jgi:2,5-furandicarboxylate decarboxylase 1
MTILAHPSRPTDRDPMPADTERFRLRRFVDRLVELGECEVYDQPIDLVDIAAMLDGNPRAVLFTAAGPEKAELTGNVMGSRRRLALALDSDERALLPALQERLKTPHAPFKVAAEDAPVQQVVRTGDDADLTALPVHLQHGLDGAPYISASTDFTVDRETGWVNVGMRRLMLRGRREAGVDLVAPSDLRAIYLAQARRGEPLPIAFVVGSHPIDQVAATMRIPVDEAGLIACLRGEPLPVVKCLTSELRVPADAEYVLEGHLHHAGHVEAEGPYGEFLGYYGAVKRNPVFHLAAVTHRRDAVFQTATIGGAALARTDTAQLCALRTEVTVWRSLETAVRETRAVYATPSSGGMYNVRIALNQRVPGEARNAIAAVFGSLANAKHVFVVDPDIDVFSDEEVDWALATRFQADRDLVVASGMRTLPLDPSLDGGSTGAKAGFDLTLPLGERVLEHRVPRPPTFEGRRFGSLQDALADGPKFFAELMAAVGSRDGREIVRELEAMRRAGQLSRDAEGRYCSSSVR